VDIGDAPDLSHATPGGVLLTVDAELHYILPRHRIILRYQSWLPRPANLNEAV